MQDNSQKMATEQLWVSCRRKESMVADLHRFDPLAGWLAPKAGQAVDPEASRVAAEGARGPAEYFSFNTQLHFKVLQSKLWQKWRRKNRKTVGDFF